MRQQSIDLMPDAIRARSQAGLRMGRYIAAGVISVVLLVVAVTHSRLGLEQALSEHSLAREQADIVLAAEAKASELRARLREINDYIDRYNRIALPLDVTAILATVIDELPDGTTLDRIDMDAGARRVVRTARSTGETIHERADHRSLTGELSGFAPDDQAIAEFVGRLHEIKPLKDVSLDFSRTRAVRGKTAREFRLSFRIDLDAPYEVVGAADERAEADHSGGEQ